MRVLHIYKDYPPVAGGMESHLRRLAEGESRRGLEVTVLVTAPDGPTTVDEENGVKVIRARRWATWASTPLSPALVSWVGRLRSDLTHLHVPYPWGELAHLVSGHSPVTVLTYQSDIVRQRWLGRLYRPFSRRLLDRAQAIITTSPAYLSTSPHLGPVAHKCRVIPLGLDPAPFLNPDRGRAESIRHELGTPLLLFVGRLRYYKGLEHLIRAMTLEPAVAGTLAILGTGPRQEALRRLVASLSLGDRVRFLGYVADASLPDYYAAADVFVLPSSERSEAFGLVQLEAMAAGKPVISTELGTGTSFVNVHGETGLVVPPRDPQALARALRELLDDPRRRRALGDAGRRRVVRDFHVETMVDRVVKLYRELLAAGEE